MGSHTTKVLTSFLTMHGVTRAKRQLPSERYHHNITLLSHWNWGSNTRYLSSILLWQWEHWLQKMHYSDAILSAMASQITGVSMVSSTVFPGAYQRKHQCSASLALVREIHRWPLNSPHKGPITKEMFPFDDVIMECDVKNDIDFLSTATLSVPNSFQDKKICFVSILNTEMAQVIEIVSHES